MHCGLGELLVEGLLDLELLGRGLGDLAELVGDAVHVLVQDVVQRRRVVRLEAGAADGLRQRRDLGLNSICERSSHSNFRNQSKFCQNSRKSKFAKIH